jgi:hypothetical protein
VESQTHFGSDYLGGKELFPVAHAALLGVTDVMSVLEHTGDAQRLRAHMCSQGRSPRRQAGPDSD